MIDWKPLILPTLSAFLIGIASTFIGANITLNVLETRVKSLENLYEGTIEKNKTAIADHTERLTQGNVSINVLDSRIKTIEELYVRSVVKNRENISDISTRLALLEQRIALLFDKKAQLQPKKSTENTVNADTIAHTEGKNM
jgi:archaellum component FlaC